jgi:hypothetical protein
MTNGNEISKIKSKMINDKWKMENGKSTDYGLLDYGLRTTDY